MQNTIRLERATQDDAESLQTLKLRAFRQEVALYGFGPPYYDSIDRLKQAIEVPYYYKILAGENLIGGCCVREIAENQYRLSSLYLDEDWQNQGVGSIVMPLIFEAFPHAKRWSLETPHRSIRNHHFYEKCGFVKVGETPPEPPKGFYLFLYAREMC